MNRTDRFDSFTLCRSLGILNKIVGSYDRFRQIVFVLFAVPMVELSYEWFGKIGVARYRTGPFRFTVAEHWRCAYGRFIHGPKKLELDVACRSKRHIPHPISAFIGPAYVDL